MEYTSRQSKIIIQSNRQNKDIKINFPDSRNQGSLEYSPELSKDLAAAADCRQGFVAVGWCFELVLCDRAAHYVIARQITLNQSCESANTIELLSCSFYMLLITTLLMDVVAVRA